MSNRVSSIPIELRHTCENLEKELNHRDIQCVYSKYRIMEKMLYCILSFSPCSRDSPSKTCVRLSFNLSFKVIISQTFSWGSPFNPNPHCFIAITNATACGWKEPLLPRPLHSPVRGRGKGGARSTALKICLIKTWVTLKLSSKAYWKWHF
jgi:hypothetical protein